MDSEHDYYAILDVPRDASDADIRRAFRALAKEHHPDSRGAGGGSGSPDRDFRLITEAYETLKDFNRRAAYDEELDEAWRLATRAARSGKRSFALGLAAGIVLAIIAVGVVNYLDRAGRLGGGKAQDSLKVGMASEMVANQNREAPAERNRLRDTASPPASPQAGKSPSPAQSDLAPPSPVNFSSRPLVDRPDLLVLGEPVGSSSNKSSGEPIEVVTGLAGRKKTHRISQEKVSRKALPTARPALRWS